MTFKFRNRRSDMGIDDRTLGQDMVLKVPWNDHESEEYPEKMEDDERLIIIFVFSCVQQLQYCAVVILFVWIGGSCPWRRTRPAIGGT